MQKLLISSLSDKPVINYHLHFGNMVLLVMLASTTFWPVRPTQNALETHIVLTYLTLDHPALVRVQC